MINDIRVRFNQKRYWLLNDLSPLEAVGAEAKHREQRRSGMKLNLFYGIHSRIAIGKIGEVRQLLGF
jgi:hypothetical protein